MQTLTFGSLIVNIEIKKTIRDSANYPEDIRPPLNVNFKSDGGILQSYGIWSMDRLNSAVGEFVLNQRNIPLGDKYLELFKAVGTKALATGRGDLLLEPIFAECGMIKRGNEYVLETPYCTCGLPFKAHWDVCACGIHYPVKPGKESV